MWIKKTAGEIQKAKQVRNTKRFISGFLLAAFLQAIGWDKYQRPFHPVFPFWGIPLVICIIMGVLFTVFRNMDPEHRVVICPTCGKSKNADGNISCSCGGNFIPMDHVTWVPDK
ncbi:hypothetical protein [Geobacter sp. DSM 9736]|uniref:hypothetical protein n=1 Tax=Geobacter sp. DSM 9736 TaxID=1277350 RepID=UPI000B513071|nr:hypothetical protein [Geobacter sp. DSM 9736]SNB44931.1 hypothetical protein SAMN06269301_0321 [Geobacter sp. DSM 9736]